MSFPKPLIGRRTTSRDCAYPTFPRIPGLRGARTVSLGVWTFGPMQKSRYRKRSGMHLWGPFGWS